MSNIDENKELNKTSVSVETEVEQPQFESPYDPKPESSSSFEDPFHPGANLHTSIEPSKPKKSKKKVAFGLVAVLLVILITGTVFYITSAKAKNSRAMSSMSPDKYFQSVQENFIKNFSKSSSDFYSSLLNTSKQETPKDNFAFDMNLKVSVSPMFQTFLSYDAFTLQNVEANIAAKSDTEEAYTDMSFSMNGTSLISCNTYSDLKNNTILLQMPELSNNYISGKMETFITQYSNPASDLIGQTMNNIFSAERFSPEKLEVLMNDYYMTLINSIEGEITLNKNVSVDLNGKNIKSNDIVATISQENNYKIVIALLERIKKDGELIGICNDMLNAMNGYTTLTINNIDEAIESLKSNMKQANPNKLIYLHTYVDETGNICGMVLTDELDAAASKTSFGGMKAIADGKTIIGFWTIIDGKNVFRMECNYEKVSGALKGDLIFTFPMDTAYDNYPINSFTINFENLSADEKKDTFSGKFTFTTDIVPGSSAVINFDKVGKKLSVSIAAASAGVSIGSINMTIEEKEFTPISKPSSDGIIYSTEEDMEAYLSSIDFDTYLSELSNKLNLDLESILYSLMYGEE